MAHTADASLDTLLDGGKENGNNITAKTPERSLNLKELRAKYILAVGLHIGLVIIHLVFSAIHFPHKYENRISVPLGSQSNALSVAIIVISQVFAVVSASLRIFFLHSADSCRSIWQRSSISCNSCLCGETWKFARQ
jgi:hypothetical protein